MTVVFEQLKRNTIINRLIDDYHQELTQMADEELEEELKKWRIRKIKIDTSANKYF